MKASTMMAWWLRFLRYLMFSSLLLLVSPVLSTLQDRTFSKPGNWPYKLMPWASNGWKRTRVELRLPGSFVNVVSAMETFLKEDYSRRKKMRISFSCRLVPKYYSNRKPLEFQSRDVTLALKMASLSTASSDQQRIAGQVQECCPTYPLYSPSQR